MRIIKLGESSSAIVHKFHKLKKTYISETSLKSAFC